MKQGVQRFSRFRAQGFIAAFLTVLCVFLVTSANADELYGRIRGVVTDATGASLPGVQVTLTNVGTGQVKTITTEPDGSYLFVSLTPGAYKLRASKASFKVFEASGIQVIQNQIYVQNVGMQLGSVSETLEVSANPVQVESTSMQLGATINANDVIQLPSLNRDWIGLQQTMPGVVTPDTRFGTNYSTNGSQAQQNSYLINGNDANDLPLNSPLVRPSPDAIAEVQMVTNTINPEFGRNSGAIMNATTKSGTNKFHGSAFEFYRDTFLNTANYFQIRSGIKQVPKIHQNQYGGTIGGPIWRNKLFFFYSLQNTRAATPQTVNTQKVFTSAQLGGAWAESKGSLSTKTIPSSLTSVLASCPGKTTWATCFPATAGVATVAPSLYNATATALTSKYVPTTSDPAGAFSWGPLTRQKINQHIGRMDLTLNQSNSIWFNAAANDQSNLNDLPFSGATLPGFGDSSIPYTKMFTASWTHTFTPNILNELRAGYTRLNFPTGQPQHVRLPSTAGFTNIIPQAPAQADLTTVAVSGYFTIGGTTNGPQPRKDQTYQLTDNFSWTKGKHAFKFGFDGRKFQVWNPFLARNNGSYSFATSGAFSTGDPGLDFLLGVPASYNQQSGSTIIAQAYEYYGYAQDQWRVRNNLTLTLGTGYQIDTPIEEFQDGGLSRVCFQPGVQSKIFPTAPIAYTLPGDPGCNKYGGPTTKLNHFGPRVGFAWSPDFGNRLTGGPGKTSLRGGFGMYFNRSEEEMNLQDLGIPPFGLSTNGATHPAFPNPFADINTGASTAQPFPYAPPAPGATPDFSVFLPVIISVNAKNLTVPHAFNWNVSLQRELPGQTIVSLGYVGSHGSALVTSYTMNPTTPAGVQNCLTLPTVVDGVTCAEDPADLTVLFPSYTTYPGDVWASSGQQTNGGWSNYNSLQFSVDKHMSHGLEFNSAYTWSHALDVSSSFEDTSFLAAGGVDPYGRFRRDYGNSAFDARQRWVITWIYTIPNIGENWGGLAKRAFGGWMFTGDNALQAGFPINFQDSNSLSMTCSENWTFYSCPDRPDIVKRPTALNPRNATFGGAPNYYFDPSSFTDNALGTLGTTPRGYFKGPAFWNADASLAKDTMITEGKSLQVRIDFFNIFNHTNFANPIGDVADPRFGRSVAIRSFTNSRLIQLGARFSF